MSFRDDDERRYGHVPPVQYPVAAQQGQPTYPPPPARRPSYNGGDDSSYHNPQVTAADRGNDELFLGQPQTTTDSYGAPYNYASASAMSGYQHQYQGQTPPTPTHSYNPQAFGGGRPHSTSLPYHTASLRNPASPTSTGYSPVAGSYAPQAYNPAAYATAGAVPQRQASYAGGYSNYGQSYGSPAIPQAAAFGGQNDVAGYAPPGNSHYASPQQESAYGQHDPTSPQYGTSALAPTSTASASYDPSYFSSYDTQQQPANNLTYSNSSSASQTPYPSYSQIPVGPNYSAAELDSVVNRPSRSSSSVSPLATPSPHQQSSALHRHPTNAPLPSRPMGNVPEEPDWRSNGHRTSAYSFSEHVTQASLIQDIEADLGVMHSPSNGNAAGENVDPLRRYNSTASTINSSGGGSEPGVSRFASTASTLNRNNAPSTYAGWEDDESDQEGAFGVYEMQQAELDDRRFSTGVPALSYGEQAPSQSLTPPQEEQPASDSDYAGMDLGMLSGGYAGNLTYGNDVGSPPETTQAAEDGRPLPAPRSAHGSYDYNTHYPNANMDYGGTGGLSAPAEHRLSFDEGDERVSIHSRHSGNSGSESPWKDDYPDMFYHPGLTNRPLPSLPPGSDSGSVPSAQSVREPQHGYSHSADSRFLGPDGLESRPGSGLGLFQQQVERSTSVSNHSSTPQVQLPGRSRTDAAEERKKALRQMTQHLGGTSEVYDPATSPSQAAFDAITLPSGRKRKFVPSKLTITDIRRCAEPWALSGLAQWIREMGEGEPDLKRKTIEEGLVKLFTTKVPTMNVADAETLSSSVTDSMFVAGILIPEEEWVKFGHGSISGVLWQLTGSGCYAPKLHEQEVSGEDISGRCYSTHCTRTLKKANLDHLMSEDFVKKEDWVTHYKVTKSMIESKPKKEIERQNVLHEIITSEEEFMSQLEVLRVLYRDQLRAWHPPIIPPNRLDKFIKDIFGRVDALQQTNKDNLLAQLKYRQNEQGPWVSGFSDIFREWIRKARSAFVGYSTGFPHAEYMVRREAERNVLFRQFLDHIRNHKRSQRLDWTNFLKAPITRLQRYTLLLGTVLKNTLQDNEEKANLAKAIEEIKNVTLECDRIVSDMQKKVQMIELSNMLVVRSGFHSVLNLDHLGRELLLEGELQRMGSKGVRWVDTHALLFDHYLILAKAITSKDGRNDKKYDVSKEPIPMPLLFLESTTDDPVSKQKGIAAPLARTTAAGPDPRLSKVVSNGDRPGLEHSVTSSSMTSLNAAAVTRLTSGNAVDDSRILYPFRVKHLGHEVYTLYAGTTQSRQDWCSKIIEAKTRHARALHAQNAEPFRLRILADGAFAYDSLAAIGKSNGVSIRGTPLDRAVREMEQVYGPGRGPAPVCRAAVNCATAFDAYGKSLIAIGTDFGVFISEASNPRGWTRSVQINKVTQIAVLEEFSLCLIIADRSLIAYPLDVVAPVSNFPAPTHDNPRRAPSRLAKDVSFFATARMKDRQLLFYKRKEGLHNTFKVLEPVYQKSAEKKSRLFGSKKAASGMTEAFRDYDEFYLPTECFSLNLFQSYIAVSTAKGLELLTLDKKQTMSIPRDVQAPAIANIASRIQNQRPLGMFKLNEQEFLLAYEDCAVYIDKHGEVSRTLIMEYSGKQKKAKGATMFGQYLILFNEDYVEVRNAENGRLRQIIAGRDVHVLDYGFRGPTGSNEATPTAPGAVPSGAGVDSKGTVKICMSHPELAGTQIVLEMLLNDGHTEKA